jgi:lauroyl/myristoyl acyltransferase
LYDWIGKLTANDKRLRRVAAICGRIPQPILYALCRMLGRLLYLVSSTELKKRIRSNMDNMLNRDPVRSIRKLTLDYFGNLAVTLYELIIDAYRIERTQNNRFMVQNEIVLQDALLQGNGAIVYTPHVGNFFYYYWYLSQRYNCMTVATAGSKELSPIFMKFKEMGCKGLDYDQTPPIEMIRTLKKHLGAGGVLFILGDFYRPHFPLAHFFGRVTRTPEGTAMLAIENKVPVIPFYGYRKKGFLHEMVFGQPILLYELFRRSERYEANDVLNLSMEQAIRTVPSQWFYWFNAEERWEQSERA